MAKNQALVIIKQTNRDHELPAFLKPVKQVASTFPAKSTICPGRRIKYRDIFFAIERNF